jgi:hypothetical protein
MRRLGKVLGVALVGLVLFAVPVKAAVNRPFSPEHSLDGKNTPAKGFDDPCGLGLDPAGRLYLSDYFHHVIDRFEANGNFDTQRTKVDPLNGPCGLAVDSAGSVYVNDFHEDVRRLSAGEFVSGAGTVIDAADSTGVAVDPATNRVYVDDSTYVAVYEPSGAPVIEGGEPLRLGAGQLQDAYGLAVSGTGASKGDIYLADAATKTVKVFSPAGALIDQIDGAGTPQGGFVSLADSSLAVDPTNGHLLVVDNTQPGFEAPAAVVDEFNAAGAYRGQLPHAIIDGGPSGLAVDSSGGAYVTSGNGEGASVLAFGAPAPGHTLSVSKEGAGDGTVSSEPAGINCGAACVAEYDAGAVVVLTATPDPASTFGGWTGCASVNGAECVVALGADRAVSATFTAIPQQTLTLTRNGPGTVSSSPPRINCGAECTAGFNEGAKVILSASPTESSTFAGFSGCEAEPAAGKCEVTMSAAKAVEATFTPIPQQQLSVARAGSGKGAVTGSSPGPEFSPIDCGGTCTASYNQGQQITLSAHPGEGQKLASWSGCDSVPTANECVVTLGFSKSVSADFEPIPHFRLTVSSQGSGSGIITSSPNGISCGQLCAASFPEGEAVLLSATPAAGSAFAGWSGACAGSGPCKVVLGADTTAIASFTAPAPPSVSAPAPSLALGRVTAKGSGASLEVSVPAAGTLSAAGKYLQPAELKVKGAGEVSLDLQLTKAGLKAREGTKHNRLRITVTVSFTPAAGKPQSLTKAISFAKAPRKKGGATLTQQGDLFVSFNGGITPSALPRHALAPITVNVEGKLKSPEGAAALERIEIAINRHGVLDTQGLPTCPRAKIAAATTTGALQACQGALVGEGSFAAHLSFEGQPTFPSRGHLLAFNATENGRPVILAHVYGTQPIPITRLLVFTITHTRGTYGTTLASSLPAGESNRASVRYIGLTLHRTYSYRGRPHSYLSASCPAPAGFPGAVFPLARARMGFSDQSTLDATVTRNCEVSE